MEKQVNIGNSKLSGTPKKPFKFILGNKVIKTKHLDDKAVTARTIGDDVVPTYVRPITDDLQNQIDALEIAGVAVSNEFGDDTHISVSQKTLTAAFDSLWRKIEDLTGEVLRGVNMVVTPNSFISEDGCDIHISANTVTIGGIFEKIRFFVDGEIVYEEENAEYVAFSHHLDIKDAYDYVIECKAKILGIEYTRPQVITRYNEFYIGAGSTYADIMDSAHARQLNGTMRHNYDITFTDSQKLLIVIGASLRDAFIRADLNGMEIEMTEETITIDEKQYVVFTSDTWSAGDYNIDING